LDRSTRESKEFATQAEALEAYDMVKQPTAEITADWADLKLDGKQAVRDLWRQKDLGQADGKFTATVPAHGVVMLKIGTPKAED
jgi:alpha-galactosidase